MVKNIIRPIIKGARIKLAMGTNTAVNILPVTAFQRAFGSPLAIFTTPPKFIPASTFSKRLLKAVFIDPKPGNFLNIISTITKDIIVKITLKIHPISAPKIKIIFVGNV